MLFITSVPFRTAKKVWVTFWKVLSNIMYIEERGGAIFWVTNFTHFRSYMLHIVNYQKLIMKN